MSSVKNPMLECLSQYIGKDFPIDFLISSEVYKLITGLSSGSIDPLSSNFILGNLINIIPPTANKGTNDLFRNKDGSLRTAYEGFMSYENIYVRISALILQILVFLQSLILGPQNFNQFNFDDVEFEKYWKVFDDDLFNEKLLKIYRELPSYANKIRNEMDIEKRKIMLCAIINGIISSLLRGTQYWERYGDPSIMYVSYLQERLLQVYEFWQIKTFDDIGNYLDDKHKTYRNITKKIKHDARTQMKSNVLMLTNGNEKRK